MLFRIIFASAFVLFLADAQRYLKAEVEPVYGNNDTCSLKISYQTRRHYGQFETTALNWIFKNTFDSESCFFYMSKPSDEIIYISICEKNGNREVEGVIHSGGNAILINPSENNEGYDLIVLHPQHVDRSLQESDFECPAFGSGTPVTHVAKDRSLGSSHKRKSKRPVIELFIVVDEFLVTYLTGGDRIAAEKFALQSVHGASAYLREVGIRLRIVGFQFLGKEESDQMYNHDGFDFIKWCKELDYHHDCVNEPPILALYAQRFIEYKKEHPFVESGKDGLPDITLVITGIVDNGNGWGGIAYPANVSGQGHPCERETVTVAFPVNLQYHSYRDPRTLILSTSKVIAHELGHILGLPHINQNTCPDGYFYCSGFDCMMTPAGSRYATTWSECSIKKLKQLLSDPEASGLSCLFTWDVVSKERSIMQSTATRCDLSVLVMVFAVAIITFIAAAS